MGVLQGMGITQLVNTVSSGQAGPWVVKWFPLTATSFTWNSPFPTPPPPPPVANEPKQERTQATSEGAMRLPVLGLRLRLEPRPIGRPFDDARTRKAYNY